MIHKKQYLDIKGLFFYTYVRIYLVPIVMGHKFRSQVCLSNWQLNKLRITNCWRQALHFEDPIVNRQATGINQLIRYIYVYGAQPRNTT